MAAAKISVDLEGLRKRRSGLRSRIERLLEKVEGFTKEGQATAAEETLVLVDTLMGRCREVQAEFELHLTDQDLQDQEVQACVELELAVVKAKATVKDAAKHKDESTVSVAPEQCVASSPKLPDWQLPKFSGNVLEFPSFWDQFEAGVHRREDISDVTKLVYLKSALSGEALEAISGFNVTNANYPVVVQTLKDRFGREEIIVEGHVLALLRTPRADIDKTGIRHLYYSLNRHLRALTALGKGITDGLTADDIFLASFKQLLPQATRKRWEQRVRTSADVKANVSTFLAFLQEEIDVQEAAAGEETLTTRQFKGSSPSAKGSASKRSERNASAAALHATVRGKPACRSCKEDHSLLVCPRFLQGSTRERWKMVNEHGACYCCLKTGHLARACRERSQCKEAGCDKFHHDLLHRHSRMSTAPTPAKLTESTSELNDAVVQVGLSEARSKERVFLQTAQGILKDGNDGRSTVTVLFDVGSQRSFIRKDIAESLRLEGRTERAIISTLGGKLSKVRKHKCVTFTLCGISNGKGTVVSALCIDRICSLLESNPPLKNEWEHLQGVTLADLFPRGPVEADVLIGADYYHDFIKPGELRGQVGQPIAVPSMLGWIVCGRSDAGLHVREIRGLNVTVEEPLNEELRRFWDIESLGLEGRNGLESAGGEDGRPQCLVTFDGERYSVSLPWKSEETALPDNYCVALQRLKQTEARLSRDASLNTAYRAEMAKYIKNGWVEKASENGPRGRTWYLPHHIVVRQEKVSTSHRIVFDASCRYEGVSLNDALNAGPPLQNDLLGIILRFRHFAIGLQADISKMFMQVCLCEQDRDVSRFLWRPSPTEAKPEVFRFTRICFGLNCSPYLAMSVLRYHVQQQEAEYYQDAQEILKNMYVDDFVTSCKTIEDARRIVSNTSHLLRSAGFRLTKWSSNVRESLEGLPVEDVQHEGADGSKVLGMVWDRHSDSFTFKVPDGIICSELDTKRQLVSKAARLYDPLGLLTPFTIRAKILFQRTWQSGIDWDDPLPKEIAGDWLKWRSELSNLPAIMVPRRLTLLKPEAVAASDLHVFTDASEDAYGAVIYLRSTTESRESSVVIVASKSRVAPLKKLSVPRLELMGALVGARLVSYIKEVMELKVGAVHCWTDSKVALAWIRSATKQWKPFVRNRVEEIQSLTDPGSWHYCPGKDNPADRATRGSALRKLVNDRQWWSGPPWLESSEDAWPLSRMTQLSERDQSIRDECRSNHKEIEVNVALTTEEERLDPARFSDLEKLLRITAYCLRFMTNCRRANDQRKGPLTADELAKAERNWLRRIQRETFEEEYQCLKRGETVNRNSKLVSLDVFLDENDIIRVGGRLQYSGLSEGAKHPIVLPSKHTVVDLLIRRAHERQLHSGVEQTLATTRQQFWVLRGRSSVKRVLRSCRICRRQNAQPFQQKMGSLPLERVSAEHAFQNVGMDFAGPVYVRANAHSMKSYILLLTCLTVRAIHLELVRDMSANGLVQALKRFFARRGIPTVIYSDNFRTFRKVAKDMQTVFRDCSQTKVHEHLASRRVTWKFITERAPWTGGAWERLVRSVKSALKKTLHRSLLTAEEMTTVLCEIESQINARPLTFVGEDPRDQEPLTPFHFLHGRPPEANAAVEQDDLPSPLFATELSKRWQRYRIVLNQLWRRWKREYVVKLSGRNTWTQVRESPSIGDIVLIAEDGVPRLKWRLGRVIDVFPSRDGLVRTVRVRTANGDFNRPVQRLHLLEPAAG